MNTQLHYFSKYHNIYLWHFTRYQWPFWICRLIKNQMVIKIVSMDSLTLKTMVQTPEFHLYDDKLLTYSHFHTCNSGHFGRHLENNAFPVVRFSQIFSMLFWTSNITGIRKKKNFCSNFGGFNCKLTRLYGIITTYRRPFWIFRVIKNQMVIKMVSMDSLTLKTTVQTPEFTSTPKNY